MHNVRYRLLLLLVIALTAFSAFTIWPSDPGRYLPNAIPWPKGRGITLKLPTINGGTFGLSTIHRRTMSLGLDLRGGTRLVLAPEAGVQVENLNAALDGARDVIERRVNEFGVAESEVNRLGSDRLSVQLPGIKPEEAVAKIGRTALLEFCQPMMDQAGDVATVDKGAVQYKPQTCEAVRDATGNIVVDSGGTVSFVAWGRDGTAQAASNPPSNRIVWEPGTADINGQTKTLDGHYLRPTTTVTFSSITSLPILNFEFTSDGGDIAGVVTDRLQQRNYPLAPFLDGQPILDSNGLPIAPHVQAKLTGGGVITGLDQKEARDLSRLLNTGAFPIPLRVIQQQDVDATLGETAVRDSVIAGEVAILLIMAFMILYYRLPGLMAALALMVYISLLLALFKLMPVTLTLSGVAAFVLSVGMAVDANILIFERMKEELRIGRNLVAALDDGFKRAWSSIRDSNISTLITCVILYWFGNQFGESAIKGFAITLALGVLLSLFSAITVTRTFMQVLIGIRPLTRHLSLFVPDLPEELRQPGRRLPAVAGGSSDGGPSRLRKDR